MRTFCSSPEVSIGAALSLVVAVWGQRSMGALGVAWGCSGLLGVAWGQLEDGLGSLKAHARGWESPLQPSRHAHLVRLAQVGFHRRDGVAASRHARL